MIFWTLIALTVIITAFVVYSEVMDGYGMPIGMGLLSLVICGVVGGIIFLICAFNIGPLETAVARNDTYQLRALGSNTGIEGHSYFLGGGYVGSKRVLNYITDQEGAIKLAQSDADVSTIFENATKPTVTIRNYDESNWWLAPFAFPTPDKYEFHVPAGSVVSDYQVGNK